MDYSVLYKVPNTMPGQPLELEAGWDGRTFKKELIYVGNFIKKTKDDEIRFSVDEAKLQHWCNTGNRMLQNGVKVPLPLKHTDNPEANRAKTLRYETGVNDRGLPALFGVIRFNNEKAAELAASTDVSIFVPAETFVDGQGNQYEYAIKHIALTDYPVIPGLSDFQPIEASYDAELELGVGREIGTIAGLTALGTASDHFANHSRTRKGKLLGVAAAGGVGALEYGHAKHTLKPLAKFASRQAKKGFAKGGTLGAAKQLSRGVFRGGVLKGASRFGLPILGGALAATGVYHAGKAVASGLKGVVKHKQPHSLSLEHSKDGKWSKIGRGLAATAIGGMGVAHIARGIGGPIAVKASRHFLRKVGGATAPLTRQQKASIITDSLSHIAGGAVLGRVAGRVAHKPSEDVKKQSKFKHLAKMSAYSLGAAGLIGKGIQEGVSAAKGAYDTHKAAKVVEQIARNKTHGTSRKFAAQARLLGHGFVTRPLAAVAAGGAIGAGSLGYAAHRAIRKAKMHRAAIKASHDVELELGRKRLTPEQKAAKAKQITYMSIPDKPNIIGKNGLGHWVRKPFGHSSNRQVRSLNHRSAIKVTEHGSEANIERGDRLSHGLNALKHASLGAAEILAAGGAIHYLGKGIPKTVRSIMNTKVYGKAAHNARVHHFKKLATQAAGTVAASSVAYSRLGAIKTNIRKAFGRHD